MTRTFSGFRSIWALLAVWLASASAPAIDLPGMDRSVAPGENFDAYANGGWLKITEIPPDKAAYGAGAIVADRTRKQLESLIQECARAGAHRDRETQQIGDFYTAFMDEAAIEARGTGPIQKDLAEIAAITNRKQLSRAIGSRLRADVDALNNTSFHTENLFGIWVVQGLTDPNHSYPYLLQGGLGMPDRDYYLSASPKMADLRARYRAHVQTLLQLAGMSETAARAERIVALEMKIAGAHATRTESENATAAVSWTRAELESKAPGLDWREVLEAARLKDARMFYVWHAKAIPELSRLAATEPLEAWKDWLAFHTISQAANFLPKAFVEENFDFHGKALTGTPAQRERWQRGVDYTSYFLGDAVGKLYVKKYFPPEAKSKVQAIVRDLEKAFSARIDKLDWMSPETKAKAKEKLKTLRVGVAYPDHWEQDRNLMISKDDPLGNVRRAHLAHYQRQLDKLRKRTDPNEWWMTPQTVNAVNLPLQNALNFPAAILQPPYFDAKADDAENYGAMGAIIGHEISHSFDDQGSLFDAKGRMANWWTQEDLAHFTAAGEALAVQYDHYKPFPDLALNGHQTLSENIADLAGLATAYDAYQLRQGPNVNKVIDGFTGKQRFFLSFAQSWRDKIREAQIRKAVATDGHAPPPYRILTVRNLDGWYEAFPIAPDQKLYLAPDSRVRVW